MSYDCYPVKTPNNQYIELLGRNYNDELSLLVDILDTENNKIKTYDDNGYTKTLFRIGVEYCETSNARGESPFKNEDELINWLKTCKNINKITFDIKPIYETIIIGNELILNI